MVKRPERGGRKSRARQLAEYSHPWRFLEPALVASLLPVMWMVTSEISVPEIRYVAWLLALIPPLIFVPLVHWLGRYEMEPTWLFSVVFLWGAGGATVISAISNSLVAQLFGQPASVTISGPIVEELAKGLALFLLFRYVPDEFNGVLDGLVYATMVALGFAMTENVIYFGRAALGDLNVPLAGVFLARAVMSPLAHPLFTGMTGLGLGLALRTSIPTIRALAAVGGLLSAIVLHSAWNSSALSGRALALYFDFFAPALLVLVAIAVLAMRRERRVLTEQLAPEVELGVITAQEYSDVIAPRRRRARLRQAFVTGGLISWARLFRFYELVIHLAFMKSRSGAEMDTRTASDLRAYRAALRLVRANMAQRRGSRRRRDSS